MKRDMDLIRRIALAVVDLPARETLSGLEGVDADTFVMHVTWMEEAGLLQANISRYLSGDSAAHVFRLTWNGCEFADAMRSDTIWAKVQDKALKPAASFTFTTMMEWAKSEILQGLPSLRTGT